MTTNYVLPAALFFLLLTSFSKGQTPQTDSLYNKELTTLGKFILHQEFDSITTHVNKLPDDFKTRHKKVFDGILKIPNSTPLSYKEITIITSEINANSNISQDEKYALFEAPVFTPAVSTDTFNLDYLNHLLYKSFFLINDGEFEQSNELFNQSQEYADAFEIEERDLDLITFRSNEIKMFLALYNQNIKASLSDLYEENLRIATSMNDTNMLLSNQLNYVGTKIRFKTGYEELRTILEEAFILNKKQKNDPRITNTIAIHETQVLIYQNTNTKSDNDKILKNLKQMRLDSRKIHKLNVDKLYLIFLTKHTKHPNVVNQALKDLNHDTFVLYCEAIIEEYRGLLHENTFADLMKLCAQVLHHFGEYETSSRLALRSIPKIREFYANHMADLIGEQKAYKIEVSKNMEIKDIEAQQMFYRYLTIVFLALSLIIGVFLFIIRNKNKQLNASNRYNVLLLQEIHHRVKNNFQISSSLLELKYRHTKSEEVKTVLNDWKTRVKSMIQIHETLYQNEFLKVNVKDCIQTLVYNTYDIFREDKSLKLNMTSNNDHYLLDIDTSINLSLILNELITNAFKYGTANNTLTLDIHTEYKTDKNKITFSDTGSGLSKEIHSASSGFGLTLIKSLVKQLSGSLEYSYNNGSYFTIYFKDHTQRTDKE